MTREEMLNVLKKQAEITQNADIRAHLEFFIQNPPSDAILMLLSDFYKQDHTEEEVAGRLDHIGEIKKKYPDLDIIFTALTTTNPRRHRYFYTAFDGLLKELLTTENILREQHRAINFLSKSLYALRNGVFEALKNPVKYEETSDD